ncbi:beta-ketoacyl synthase [Paenimyroides tangerinum]|uniref:Beta-ketoacyl synthase n=1 Tax=Paenimyroides tangerinum TaxID=2488728 RepID=A0A3P3WAG0_9FLAO|nr:beta-ketoacyl synthase N-terminal-like domain-containing protein [Paenimyroides tangerinum]RRJ90599.1 beta-ketoacyl synthase [Paenimyroides tangerinum]
MKNVFIKQTNCITPLGFDVASNWNAIQNLQTGISLHEQFGAFSNIYASCIPNSKIKENFQQIEKSVDDFSRIEQLLISVMKPIIDSNGIQPKTALILSTTKGNISALENNDLQSAFLSQLAKKIANYFQFQTEPIIVSNACVSGVMALSVAKRMLQMQVFENAYVVAVDEVTEFVVSGFNSFQAMSDEPCKPYDASRKGVNLGEAAAVVFVDTKPENALVEIIGDANINDANHISGPSRTGEGLFLSIQSALKEANITTDKIDAISLHGTATLYNDEMEAIALNRLQMQQIPAQSMKGYFGHTLGTSGLLETVLLIESMQKNTLIVSKGFVNLGVSQPIQITTEIAKKDIKYALKTASGFGGCNSAIVLKK